MQAGDDEVLRSQFPLTLAWALTHWKAQGMSLERARVQLSKRTAGVAGVGFVAMTRVKHPRGLMFEQDLPEYEDFQEARQLPVFRWRVRYELRLRAAASETLRRHGFCEADPWSREDARRAEAVAVPPPTLA